MSVGLLSDEVAEDYKNSLEDLTMNSRYEISNLTVIAKENTEHAMQISRVLENHIRNAPPDRKLPALYVLDSVVKNVGTPYTLFLGRNLYQTFMHAYSQVNIQVRNKLNEMLKTWKEPVPGSQDPRPVFPQDTTRPIENALIKLKTSDLARQQQEARNQQALLGRAGPTPSPAVTLVARWPNPAAPASVGIRPGYSTPPSFASRYPQQNGQNTYVQPRPPYPQYIQAPPSQPVPPQFSQPVQQSYQHPSMYPQQPPAYQQNQPSAQSVDPLHQDIEDLIIATKREFASAPFDTATQGRLKALLDLQTILKTTVVSPIEIQQIRSQVAQLSLPRPPVTAPIPTPVPPAATPYVAPPPPQHTPQTTPDIQALLSSNTLADILVKAAKAQQPPTPTYSQGPSPQAQVPPAQSYTTPTPAPAIGGSSLIESLRAAGMLPTQSTPPVNSSVSSQPFHGYPPLPPFSHSPSTPPIISVQPTNLKIRNDVELTSASLKIPRPHLISRIYEARPNQCSTCGRRFLATEEGRTKKARHLDWHFRTNQRIAESVKRGQSRSWYVDELEWIKNREANEEEISTTPNGTEAFQAQAAAKAANEDPKNRYLPVPADTAIASLPCPICQEKFVTSWNDEAQDFVWMDAVKIGARVYHASCHAEVKKDGGSTPLRTSTPDSVLGKRKMGGADTNAIRSKVQRATP